MGFTTACFIRKNTPELRSKLKELGYDICCCTEFKDACWLNTFLLNKTPSVHGIGYVNNARSENPNIDCGTNEELAKSNIRLSIRKNKYLYDEAVKTIKEQDASI